MTFTSILNIDRNCPDGYFFAGDDTPGTNEYLKSYWPLSESPIYSCYKNIPVEGINDGLNQCYTSTMSDGMEGRIVIFEDVEEVQRVFTYIMNHQPFMVFNYTLLTSAIYFEDIKEWIYLGTSKCKRKIVIKFITVRYIILVPYMLL